MSLNDIKTVTTIKGSDFVDDFLKAGWTIVAVEHKQRPISGVEGKFEIDAYFTMGAESANAQPPKNYEKLAKALSKAKQR